MTPEEQFMKIENALRHQAELGAQHEERLARNEVEIEKNSAAIRDLIIISRTLIDSQRLADQKFDERMAALAESHRLLAESQRLSEESQRRFTEDFSESFNALLQAQVETEHKLQRWIDRQGNGRA